MAAPNVVAETNVGFFFEEHSGGGWTIVPVATAMTEVFVRSATATGYCSLAICARLAEPMPPAYQQLSDHCPVVMKVDHVDAD